MFFLPLGYALCMGVAGLVISHGHLVSGNADMEGFRPGRVRLGLGADLGAMWLTGASPGVPPWFPMRKPW